MKNVLEFMNKKSSPRTGISTCIECGAPYELRRHDIVAGELCGACDSKEMRKNHKFPSPEEHKIDQARKKDMKSILYFEKVSTDLKTATVNSYNPKHETQSNAKQKIIQFVNKFDGNESESLVFSGSPGLGKSHLGYSTAKAIRDKGYKALFIKTTHLLEHIKNTYKKSSSFNWEAFEAEAPADEESILKMIENLDLLVLDDMGSEYVKADGYGHESWASDILFKVYDSRLGRSTISTTNYSEKDLERKYGNNGARIIDRMLYNAAGIRLEGDSYRRKKNAF